MSLKSNLKKNSVLIRCVHGFRNWRRQLPYTSRKRLNIIKTLQVNFGLLPFRQACKLPIFLYGRVAVYNLSGRALIQAPLTRGMIKLGRNTDLFSAPKGSAMLNISGTIIFNGPMSMSVDYALDVSGTLEFGDLPGIGSSVRIRCWDSISIGDMSRIGVETQIFDTNFHFTRNIETGRINRKEAPTVLGKACWIGNRVTIMKGTRLPDFSIVAGNSLLNKDYTKDAPLCPTLAGTPAKIIATGNARVFGNELEAEIATFFRNNPDATYYQSSTGIIDESATIRKDVQ